MRIALIGQDDFGAKVMDALIKDGEEVVIAGTSQDPKRAKAMLEAAQARGIPCVQPARWRAPEVMDRFRSHAPDLGVMAFVTDKIPGDILRLPRLGTIEYHPSLLPRHRGSSAINWAIIQGDTRTGLSIFWVDDGIDTGPVLLQKTVDVTPDDTVGSIYFNRLFPLGVEAMVEAVRLVRAGKASRIPQDNSKATYEPPIQESHVVIDWNRPVHEVYNLIRGANPQPGATTFWKAKKLKLFDCRRCPELDGSPAMAAAPSGAIVDVNAEGFAVAARDGAIRVKRVQPEGSAKLPAAEFLAQSAIHQGDRLGA